MGRKETDHQVGYIPINCLCLWPVCPRPAAWWAIPESLSHLPSFLTAG